MKWTKSKQLKFLHEQPVIRVATVNKDGQPQVTPVCHVVRKGKIYWASDFGAAKLKNLERNPSVSLVADVYRETWKNMGGVEARGTAKLYREGRLFLQVRDQLYKKYRAYSRNSPFAEGEAVIVEVEPKKLISWWY